MAQAPRVLTYQGIPVWRHIVVIKWTLQSASAVIVVALVAWFFNNIVSAIEERNIPAGFGFLSREYQTPIGEHFIPYESDDTFGYALFVAATNTALVAVIGVVLATGLGILIGVARLSSNWLVARIAGAYVEFFRNVPLLIQLLFWFYIVLSLPPTRNTHVLFDRVYVNNAGVSIPWPLPTGGSGLDAWSAWLWLALAAVGVAAGVVIHRALTRREIETGHASYPLISGVGAAVAVGAVSWIILMIVNGAAPLAISTPAPAGAFGRIADGFTVRAGLFVLLIGLVIYTAAFIAEIVRAGIQSVRKGQIEAARAVGLTPIGVLRLVTFPQALRVIVPPLISQYLNLTKNSSLGGAIGYSDLTSVTITMTQTAPAISLFLLITGVYLAMSLTWSLIGNLYNWRTGFKGA